MTRRTRAAPAPRPGLRGDAGVLLMFLGCLTAYYLVGLVAIAVGAWMWRRG